MISPHTPPGTKIVCIDVGDRFARPPAGTAYVNNLDGLTLDAPYTAARIEPSIYTKSGFVVILAEIDRSASDMSLVISKGGFDIARFRYAELPRSILQCLEVNPADVAKHKERSKVRERLYAVMRKAGV